MKEKTSVIVLNYNDADTTIRLVNQIQKYQNLDYIIIVDNASTDDSIAKLSAIEKGKIKVIKCKDNKGYGAGNNAGIILADELGCKYAIISNPDVFFDEEIVEECKKALISCSNTVIASPVQLDINNKEIESVAWSLPSAISCGLRGSRIGSLLFRISCWKRTGDEKKYVEVDCVPGAFLAIDIDAFKKIGMYDENVFLYCEESIVGARAKAKGYKTLLITDKHYRHEHSVSIDKSVPEYSSKMKLLFASRNYFMEEYLRSPRWVLMIAKCIQKRRIRKINRFER